MAYNHDFKPPPFNAAFRPGYGEALSDAYCRWCNMNPKATQEDRKKAHLELSISLACEYPTVEELKGEGTITKTVDNY